MANVHSEKLAKFMARCGVASRRKCENYIRAGWVRVNDDVVTAVEARITPERDPVLVRGKAIHPPRTFRHILLNKPAGFICTCKSSREKGPTIGDLVKVPERVFPVGRLDKDTSGLILLTNDGGLTQRLTHPSFGKEKEYVITTGRAIIASDLRRLRKGIRLEDGLSKFLSAEKMGARKLRVVLSEGRKRQIRRTLEAIQLPIANLHRIRVGTLNLGGLPAGKWRDLTPKEMTQLKSNAEGRE